MPAQTSAHFAFFRGARPLLVPERGNRRPRFGTWRKLSRRSPRAQPCAATIRHPVPSAWPTYTTEVRSLIRSWFVVAGILATLIALRGTCFAEPPGAKALEGRLNAPCCYNGTLDIHESELARSLRTEIEQRLAAGESSEAIQTDFVSRYGEQVIAARSDSPLRAMGVGLTVLGVIAAGALLMVVRRWTRATRAEATPPQPKTHDLLDETIDAELAEMDA